MFNCEGCWDNPCRCGRQYQHLTADELRDLIAVLNKLMEEKTLIVPMPPPQEGKKFPR